MTEASVGHQCPECVTEGRRTQRSARTIFGGSLVGAKGYVTLTLIAINVLVMIASAVSAGGHGLFGGGFGGLLGGDTPLLDKGSALGALQYQDNTGQKLLGPGGISAGEYYRLVTSMFLHLGPLHLLTNMWALWVLGRTLEAVLGPIRFLVLYLVAGLGGSVAVYLFSPFPGGAGASGAIFGLFSALFIILKRLRRDTSSIIPLLVINLAISLVPGISLAAHLGGLVTGAMVAFALAYSPAKNRNLYVGVGVGLLLGVMAVAVVVQTTAIRGFIPIG
jgi:membrane associated rhomboid family serine protease